MAEDIQRITGTHAKVAARLCNFETGEAFLKSSHVDFLDSEVRNVIQNMEGPWVDLFGYASRRGDESFNMTLSVNRVKSVMNRISQYATKVNFQIRQGLGETESGGNEADNSGYYRAVEVYVYAYKPQTPVPPQPAVTLRRVVFRSFSKIESEPYKPNFGAPDTKTDGINDLLKFALSAAQGKTSGEGFLGDQKGKRISHIPAGHRVNKVILDQDVRYDSSIGGQVTQTTTEITYEWGEPRQNVTVETRYKFTWNQRANAPIITTKVISRSEADQSSVIIPPDPPQ
jgi:hypothetical protein